MYFVGLDLAWGERNPTGVAVVDDNGVLVQVSAQTDDASILAAIRPYVADDCVVGIDAPLIVTNPKGNRPCEAALNKDFAKFQAGAHPSNTGKPEFANGTRGGRLAAALDLDLDPHSPRPRRALEVYPHAASVALFRLGRTLKYKDKKGRKFEKMQSELLRLMTLIEGLKDADVPLRVSPARRLATAPPFGRNRNAQKRIAKGRGSGRRRAVRLRRALSRPSARRRHRVRRHRHRVHPHADPARRA